MGFFDTVYDQMSFEEVTYRIPSELAIKALQRRIINLDTLLSFFASCGSNSNAVKELKQHINTLLNQYSASDILAKFEEKYHPTLFAWVDNTNKERLKKDGKSNMTVKLLFNMTDAKDGEGLEEILDRVLAEDPPKQSAVISVIYKSDVTVFPQLVSKIARDKRPEVRCCLLSVGCPAKQQLISNNTLLVGLKALAKSSAEEKRVTDKLDFNLFASLKAGERLIALKKYLDQFPLYRRASVFINSPTEEELDFILFAGCIDQNDLVVELKSLYDKITKEEPPKEEKEEA